jgi:S-adenosylmethionine:tRNA ribosyltransferase-isomerase
MFDIEDYTYDLPEELIAQEPAPEREESRLFLVDRENDAFSDHRFSDLPDLLRAGDLLVVNDTRVVPARLFGHKATGGRVELLVLDHPESGRAPALRRCLMKASKRARKGDRIELEGGLSGAVEAVEADGVVVVRFSEPARLDGLMAERGAMPLPPYIKRHPGDPRSGLDRDRYQTVYAGCPGAVAAPTAGLHFSQRLLERLAQAGVAVAPLTLHVGHGTFRPVRTRDIREHELGEEAYRIEPETADRVNRARAEGRRVIAVGTTVVRTMETAADAGGRVAPGAGRTRLMITPGYRFRAVDGLITNFHLPASSLLFLVSAFAGLDRTREAYRRAVRGRYRFYSYGDAMLIL